MNKKKSSDVSQIKYGAVLSYVLIIINSMQGIFLAPYILSQIGSSNYGVYKTIAAFSATILVLDLGVGTTVMRYTAKFRAEKKFEKMVNFVAMGLWEAAIMAVVIGVISSIFYFYLPTFYASSFTIEEVALAKILFLILGVNTLFVVVENVLNGVIMGNNHFVFANSVKLGLLLLRIIASILLLQWWKSAIIIVSLTLGCSIITMILQIYYIRNKIGIQIKFRIKEWDSTLFKESLGYTSLMFAQTIAIQANGNIDNIVISRIIGPLSVTIYSFGIQFFNMYESLAMAFSNLMLPHITKQIKEGAGADKLQNIVTRVGRMQFVVLGAVLAGFFCLGKEFIYLWLGKDFEDVYYLSLIMMIPVTFTLIQNVCLSILRARNMMKFRTFSLIFTMIVNLILTIVGTRLFGFYAAALGTGFSIIVGSIILMNIYYHKKIEFKVFKFYGDVFRRLITCLLIPVIIVWFLVKRWEISWGHLLVEIGVFILVYIAMLWIYGFSKEEKLYLWKGKKEKNEKI